MLNFLNGEPFATGSIRYFYTPETDGERSSRIFLPVEIAGIQVTAMVDTGAPYVVCTPEVGRYLGLEPAAALAPGTLQWHGRVTGHLHRHAIMLRAETGENLTIEATIFVPDTELAEAWKSQRRPFVIGMVGCLERMRFAVDPANDMFYFGPSP